MSPDRLSPAGGVLATALPRAVSQVPRLPRHRTVILPAYGGDTLPASSVALIVYLYVPFLSFRVRSAMQHRSVGRLPGEVEDLHRARVLALDVARGDGEADVRRRD